MEDLQLYINLITDTTASFVVIFLISYFVSLALRFMDKV